MRRVPSRLPPPALALLVFVLLAPLGCGTGAPESQDACGVPSEIVVLGVESLPGSLQGQTDRCAPGGTRIEVLSSALDRVFGVRLVAHELAHAAGHSSHLDDPACILYPVIFNLLPPPCPAELTYMQGVPGPLFVTAEVNAPHVVASAVAYWNNAVGRELFVLRQP